MRSVLRFAVDFVFVFSVIFIWFMLLYQFVLTIAGFFWRESRRRRDRAAPAASGERPFVSVLIPARNEEKVIGPLLRRLGEMAYPRDRMEILVIDDASTDRTAEAVAAAAAGDPRVRRLAVPAGEGGRGKAAVLNRGMAAARGGIIAVYDADNVPERDSLDRLVRGLEDDPKTAAVCGKFRAYNKGRNLLTRLINLEGLAFQWIVQAGRAALLGIVFIPGTNFVIRREAVEEAGGWDEEALTEDAELTLRLYRAGRRVRFAPAAVTWEQEPERLSTWIRQRTRWARGNSYLIARHGRELLRKPSRTTLEIWNLLYLYYFFIFAILASDLLFLLSAAGLVRIRLPGPFTELWGLAVLLFLLEILLALSYEREDGPGAVGVAVFAYFVYTKLWAFVVLRAFYQEFVARKSRTWAKTERFDPGSDARP